MTLNPYQEYDEPIFTADAVDVDERGACPNKDVCPCGEIRYSFGTGNDKALFNIDSNTGQVRNAVWLYKTCNLGPFVCVC